MRITILGATGATGQQVLAQALDAGHEVSVLVRDPDRLPHSTRDLTAVTIGDPTQSDDLESALAGSDAVISVLGPGADLASHAARALVRAGADSEVRRVVVLSALGAGRTNVHAGVVPRIFGRLLMRSVLADKAFADDLIRASELDWTLVHPAILTNGRRTSTYRAVEVPDRKVADAISRADVADFMLRAIADDRWSRRDAILLTR